MPISFGGSSPSHRSAGLPTCACPSGHAECKGPWPSRSLVGWNFTVVALDVGKAMNRQTTTYFGLSRLMYGKDAAGVPTRSVPHSFLVHRQRLTSPHLYRRGQEMWDAWAAIFLLTRRPSMRSGSGFTGSTGTTCIRRPKLNWAQRVLRT